MAKKIMIVDDEAGFRLVVRRYIERFGYAITEISNGFEAYHRLLKEPHDLLLLDYILRDVGGDVICRMIRGDEKLKDLPIIIITACHNVNEESFKAYGANEVIYKPVASEELVQKINRCFGIGLE